MMSHPSPFHRQRQSNKSLDPSGQTAKFLYTILKQLDLKNIDWNEVAHSLGITNGHAARMRWSRFRAQIEGLDNSYSRKPGRKRDGEKKRKLEQNTELHANVDAQLANGTKRMKTEMDHNMKSEDSMQRGTENDNVSSKFVKDEPKECISLTNGVKIHHPTITTVTVPQTPLRSLQFPPQFNATHQEPANGISNQPLASKDLRNGFQPHNYLDTEIFKPRSQQYASLGYGRHVNHADNKTSPYYRPAAAYYSQYPYPSLYNNNTEYQYHYNYVQQPPESRFQTQQSRKYGNWNVPAVQNTASLTPAHNSLVPQLSDPFGTQPTAVQGDRPTLAESTAYKQNPTITPAPPSPNAEAVFGPHICELAAEASYPWPYSEASLSYFTQQANDTVQNSKRASDEQANPAAQVHSTHQTAKDVIQTTCIVAGATNSNPANTTNMCSTVGGKDSGVGGDGTCDTGNNGSVCGIVGEQNTAQLMQQTQDLGLVVIKDEPDCND